MNTPRWKRVTQTLFTTLIVLIQFLSPLRVLAQPPAQPPLPVRNAPLAVPHTSPSATPSPQDAESQAVTALDAMLNLPPDTPADQVEERKAQFRTALTRYASAVPPVPNATTDTAGRDAFLWYLEGRPDAAAKAPFASTAPRERTSWLLLGKPGVHDKARFENTFSHLVNAGTRPSSPQRQNVESVVVPVRPAAPAAIAATTPWNTNLVQNGGFESGLYAWTEVNVNSNAHAVAGRPTASTFPTGCASGNIALAQVYNKNTESTGTVARIEQTRDISDIQTSIDTGRVNFSFSACLGGYQADNDYSKVHLVFYDQSGNQTGEWVLTGPSAGNRGNVTKSVLRSASGSIPQNSRSMKVWVDFINPDYRNTETWINGDTDNVNVTLTPKVDLSVQNPSHSPNPINAGQTFTMSVQVHNGGSGYSPSRSRLTISNLPPNLTLTTSQPSGCTLSGASVTCNLTTLDYGSSTNVNLTFRAGNNTFATYSNILAVVASTESWAPSHPDIQPGNNQALFSPLTIQPNADLAVQVGVPTAATRPPTSDASYDVKFTVTNNGPSLATHVTMTSTFATGVKLTGVSSGASATCTASGSPSTHVTLSCSIPSLASLHQVQINATASMSFPAGTSVSITGHVRGDGNDPDNRNNSATGTTYLTSWDTAIGASGLGGTVHALIMSGSILYAGGAFGVKRWTGTVWTPVGSLGDTTYALAIVGSTLYAGGTFGVKRWTGSTWASESGPSGTVRALLASGSTL